VKERLARLKAIRKLIKTYRIESQEILLGHLQKEGFMVTWTSSERRFYGNPGNPIQGPETSKGW